MSNTADEQFDGMIERSSLGTAGARQLRQRTPQPSIDEVRRLQRDQRAMSAEQRLADRRERLITAAYILFAEPGFHATTIERLCAAARMSNRAFYECFASREDLLREVYERCVTDTFASMSQAMEKAPPTIEARVVAAVEQYVRFVTADARRARIMHLEVTRAGFALYGPRQRAVATFAHLIEEAVGELQGTPGDLHLFALGLSGVIQELLVEWMLDTRPPLIELMIDTASHMFLASVGASRTN
ncbi:hypothetical protein Pth03_78110 [Planotetraspora thailandica]|uniref:HTH tetR-type domain-containing protein n=1 Tax=Planotetraspora thailandica TaxID=487172 RepID=A0A8J3Y207_9ACTN|nr:TetR/AcrR family transcriptional regulator [Planotetraspora thailandica]GII59422.1 hypothetical protein Pth03_78110 [Planotetraspora thailandica]